MDEYRQAVESLRTSLALLHVPEDQWPSNIRITSNKLESKSNVTLSAFEELERKLRQRNEANAPPMG
ncbi:hypothetical protein EW026_g1476 [Hermanssonia centrifuga]|uniref:Uncharacterized protein n=2 Tax=Hermanssonia centrifuga TaxID=98765 RepID=A0A2R6NWR2_9APHY|nr:hypothetical protein PHLCEN_2v7328 [Hermanssonia centrifuga]THH01163.1 hypothetical protein EW026_g1476 [Hermanssonia centrifuga]